MTMQTLSLSAIEASGVNPRRKFDAKSIEGLAASIKTDGLLHNLVVSPVEGKRNRFRIVSGERRYRAMKMLEQRGDLPEGFAVPVEVRAKLSKDDKLRIATVENLQRQNLAPLEETAALTKLVHKRITLEEVSAQTGLSANTIKRRLALNGLCKEAKAALVHGEISLSQAEALSLGADEAQQRILEEIARGHECSGGEIKSMLLDDHPTVALAIFPLEQYTGTITTDLFAEDETSYFDDADEFARLQEEALAQLAKHHEECAPWVDLTNAYRLPEWHYRKAKKREKGGVVINLAPCGRVDILEGVMRHDIEKDTASATAENPAAPPKVKAAYSAPLCRLIGWHKSVALQELLLADPRKAREVALVDLLVGLRPHEALRQFSKTPQQRGAYGVIETQARLVAVRLGLDIEADEPFWSQFTPRFSDAEVLYEAVKGLRDQELDAAHTLLTVLSFGQENCERLDTRHSLFNMVAGDLGADMRNHWRPDAAFFEKRNREQLLAIAQECGCSDVWGVGLLRSYKKGELIGSLLRHFEDARMTDEPTEAHLKARQWLPDCMLFPAVDPSVPAADEEPSDTDLDADE